MTTANEARRESLLRRTAALPLVRTWRRLLNVLPAARGANGGLKVEGIAGGVAQPVSGTVAVTGVSTEATLALIKAKTDNLDVALSTRTKPADTQAVSAASLPLPSGAATEASLATLHTDLAAINTLLTTITGQLAAVITTNKIRTIETP